MTVSKAEFELVEGNLGHDRQHEREQERGRLFELGKQYVDSDTELRQHPAHLQRLEPGYGHEQGKDEASCGIFLCFYKRLNQDIAVTDFVLDAMKFIKDWQGCDFKITEPSVPRHRMFRHRKLVEEIIVVLPHLFKEVRMLVN